MKRRVASFILASAMALSMLTGCGNAGTGESSGSNDSTVQSYEGDSEDVTVTSYGEYTEENPYHLVFCFIEMFPQNEDARAAVQDAINEKLIPELHMEVELLPLDFSDESLPMMLSGGDALDIIPIYYEEASSYLDMDAIFDLNTYMDTADGQAIIDTIGEEMAKAGQLRGVLFGLPAIKEINSVPALFMRADICDELGITEEYGLIKSDDEYANLFGSETEKTSHKWEELTPIFEKVKAAYPDMTVLYKQGNAYTTMSRFDYLLDSFGVLDWETDHNSTTVVNQFETDAYKKDVMLTAEWFDAGYINKDALTNMDGTATAMHGGNTFSYVW